MSDAPPPAADGVGLGSLTDLTEIGRGGFATVYRAFQPRFGRTVAVKVLDPGADPLSIERFERECEAMGMLSSHPHIVTIFDAGVTEDGKPYLIMEFMPDGSLDDQGPIAWPEVAEIGVKLAGALHTAHEATVLHRDVKPANVLRSTFGEPCLSDFGLARFGGQAKTTGVVTATLLHAPPEILGGQPASPRSDVYSLGSSLFTLLRGDAPFSKDTDESILPLLARIADDPVPALTDVPEELAAAITASLAKDPADRPESAAAFGQLLQDAQAAAGVPVTTLPMAGQASVRAAREVASVPTDPNRTIVRGRSTDPDVTIARTPVTPLPVDQSPAKKRRPLVLAIVGAIVVVGAVVIGGLTLLGGDDSGTPSSVADPTTGGDAADAPTTAELATAADDVADQVNAHRADAGLDPLAPDAELVKEARRYARISAEQGAPVDIDDEALATRHPNRWFQVWANTTAAGSVDDAYQASLDQDALRANLELENADVIGVGVAVADDGTYFLVEMMGALPA